MEEITDNWTGLEPYSNEGFIKVVNRVQVKYGALNSLVHRRQIWLINHKLEAQENC